MYIEIQEVSKTYPQKSSTLQVLDNISLTIEKGDFICLLGPSGCGKSTLLNIIAGFEAASHGTVTIDGKEVTEPNIRHVTIFQNYGLLPSRNVQKNIELGLEALKLKKKQRSEVSEKYMELVGLTQFRKSHPHQLSGGMQQRVALARALAVNPDILFMDEPFGALDAITRIKMQNEILSITKSQRKTVIFVTHDIEEAVYLADRIVIMTPNPGKIKTIIPVVLPTNHDRTSDEFIAIRDKVFDAFDMKESVVAEYNI